MITNLKNIKTIISSKGVKATFQRIKIMEYLLNNKSHPTVEEIFIALVKQIPTLSKTTIYNTLNLFVEKNIVKTLNFSGVETRYDVVAKSHHHFICKRCRKIYDINVECNFLCDENKVVNGNQIEEVTGYFKGICKKCLNNDKALN